MKRLAFGAALLVLGFPAVGVAAQDRNSACHSVSADLERLACYDKATGFEEHGSLESTLHNADSSEPTGAQWRISEETSNLDGRTDVWLSVFSENLQPNQIGRPEKARLWVRCMNNSTNVFITFNDYTPDNQNVRYKLDDGSLQKIWMVHMQGGEGVGLWSGRAAIPFAKNMFGRRELTVGYKSYNNLGLEFTFDISGLRNQIDPLASSCQWRP